MKRIKPILAITVIGGLLFSILLPLAFQLRSSTPAYKLSQEMEEEFRKEFLVGVERNSSIAIKPLSFYNEPTETEIAELLDYAVYNNTDEYVDFPNTAYGMQLFTPDENSQKWTEILPIVPFRNETTAIPPAREGSKKLLENTFFLLYTDYGTNLPEKLRFCVFGIGRTTKNKYADCLDIFREK